MGEKGGSVLSPVMTAAQSRSSQARPPKGVPWWRSTRYSVAILACVGYANFFFQRINLSMAVVCMVNHTALDLETSHSDHVMSHLMASSSAWASSNGSGSNLSLEAGGGVFDEYNYNISSSSSQQIVNAGDCPSRALKQADKEDGELVWPKETQGLVLGGLYWGYAVSQLPAQRIIQRFGTKRSTLAAVMGMSILSLLLPVIARAGPWWFIAVRALQGVCSALGVPAMYAVWGKWAPPQERTTLVSICFSGSHFANTLVYPISGLLCKGGFGGGWPSVFYVWGIVGLAWCALWSVWAHESPDDHPRIHPEEREYINSSIGAAHGSNQGSIPWKKILSSLPVWAIVIAQLGYNWSFFMFLAVLPQYMYEVLKFDIASNGFFTMLPYLCLGVITNVWGLVCQKLQRSTVLSVTNVRKLSTAIGDVIPAALFICISFLDCSRAITVVILMTLAIGVSGTNLQGFLLNPYDIAPRYATAVLSFSNSVAVVSGIFSPYLVAALTKDKSREQWQTVFFLTTALNLVCLAFYLAFGSGKELAWHRAERGSSENSSTTKELIIPTPSESSEKELGSEDEETKGENSIKGKKLGPNGDFEVRLIIRDEKGLSCVTTGRMEM